MAQTCSCDDDTKAIEILDGIIEAMDRKLAALDRAITTTAAKPKSKRSLQHDARARGEQEKKRNRLIAKANSDFWSAQHAG